MSSAGSARAHLLDRDLNVGKIEEKKSILSMQIGPARVKRSEVMHFSRQMAAFVRSGVPLLEAVDVVAEESTNPKMRETMRIVGERLRAGAPFSEALAEHPRVFPRFYVAAVRSAELTGRLDAVLEQVARYQERDLEARRKVKSALTYPAVILVLSAVTVVVLSAFVLPRFRSFFDSFEAELPLTTRLLLGGSDFVSSWWWAMALGAIAGTAGLVWFVRRPRGRSLKDRFLLRVPIINNIVRYAIVERFCRMLSSMLSAGVQLPDAMKSTAQGTGNTVYEKALMKARDEMIRGDGFARPLTRTGLFPGAINQMVRVGEDTGSLDEQLESAASFYELELDFSIKRMTTLFEPTAIVVMALMVGFVALSMVQAMYGVLGQVGG